MMLILLKIKTNNKKIRIIFSLLTFFCCTMIRLGSFGNPFVVQAIQPELIDIIVAHFPSSLAFLSKPWFNKCQFEKMIMKIKTVEVETLCFFVNESSYSILFKCGTSPSIDRRSATSTCASQIFAHHKHKKGFGYSLSLYLSL